MPFRCPAYYIVSTVRQRLRSVLTGLSKPQLENLSLLTFGLFAAGNCQLPRIAAKLPLLVGAASLTQRLRRLLMNRAIEPATLYPPVARFLLATFAGGSVRLILDAMDLGGRLPVLFVAVAYRGRALPLLCLPLLWRMLPTPGCSPPLDAASSVSRRRCSLRSLPWCRSAPRSQCWRTVSMAVWPSRAGVWRTAGTWACA